MHNLVKSFLTSINFDSLSRKIKNPCLVINKKFFNKGDTLMYQNRISLLLILAFSLSILISCGGDPGTNIKSGKVHTGYYDEMSEYVPMVYKRSDIVKTNDNYTISFKLPKIEPFDYTWEEYINDWGYQKEPRKRDIIKYDWSNALRLVYRNHYYRKRFKVNYGDTILKIARTDIKTANDNYKYYLYITLNGVESNDYRVVTQYNRSYKSFKSYELTNIIESFNMVFTTMMRDDKDNNKLKPIHVENYWVYNDLATTKENSIGPASFNVKVAPIEYLIKFQLFKFIDEIDYGYRGKLPPKPINEDDEY